MVQLNQHVNSASTFLHEAKSRGDARFDMTTAHTLVMTLLELKTALKDRSDLQPKLDALKQSLIKMDESVFQKYSEQLTCYEELEAFDVEAVPRTKKQRHDD